MTEQLCPSCGGPMPEAGAAVACMVCNVRYCSAACTCPVTLRAGHHEHRILQRLADLEDAYESRDESWSAPTRGVQPSPPWEA